LDDTIALRIERDRRDRRPVAGLAAPASWVGLACPLVKFVPAGQQTAIPAGMALYVIGQSVNPAGRVSSLTSSTAPGATPAFIRNHALEVADIRLACAV